MNDDKFTNLTGFDISKYRSDSDFSHEDQLSISAIVMSLMLGTYYAQIQNTNLNEDEIWKLQYSIDFLEDQINRAAKCNAELEKRKTEKR